jgi:hypothetical protein
MQLFYYMLTPTGVSSTSPWIDQAHAAYMVNALAVAGAVLVGCWRMTVDEVFHVEAFCTYD